MHVTTDDGVDLVVRVAGSGPGLVLVHGFGGAKEDFDDHVEVLARDHTVVTFDHRGHGESGKPDDADAYSLDRLAVDTRLVAEAAGLETFRILGHSMGGMVVRRLLLADPTGVDAVVFMDTSPGPVPGIDPDIADLGAMVAITDGMDVLKVLQDELDPLGTPAYERLLRERPGYREYGERKWASLSPVMWATMIRDIVHQPEQDSLLGAITTPTLVIVGEQDEPFLGCSERIAAAISGARLVVIPDAGHSPQFENGPFWIETVQEFLATLPVASS